MKKATIKIELVPEADEVPNREIVNEIMIHSEIPWMSEILEVKIEKPTSLKKW